jgi:very-short-patch-repair endonuclease
MIDLKFLPPNQEIQDTWNRIVECIKPKKRGLIPMLRKAVPLHIPDKDDGELLIGFHPDSSYAKTKVEELKNIEVILSAVGEITGIDTKKMLWTAGFYEEATHAKEIKTFEAYLDKDSPELPPIPDLDSVKLANIESKHLKCSSGIERKQIIQKWFDENYKYIEKALDKCESPIEEKLFMASLLRLRLIPQHEIGKYRCDFIHEESKTVIEVDGHEYHHTQEQRTNDLKRQRFLQSEGWQVIRFTGSEIYRDAKRCISEIKKIIRQGR